jgi:hypothetical protein
VAVTINAGRAAPQAPIALGVSLPSRVQGSPVGTGQAATPVVLSSVPAGRGAKAAVSLLQPGPALGRRQTNDRQINALQEAARVSTSQAKADPQSNRNVLEALILVSGDNVIHHGLGRPFRGANLTSMSASVTWHIQRASGIATDAYQILVHVSQACVADLVVWG